MLGHRSNRTYNRNMFNVKRYTVQDKYNMSLKLSEILANKSELLFDKASIKIIGNTSLHIENYKKIILYSEEKIVLSDKTSLIVIEGKRLNIYDFYDGNMDITGNIISIKFEVM